MSDSSAENQQTPFVKYYSPISIPNAGERTFDRLIEPSFHSSEYNWHIINDLRLADLQTKKSSDCDFIFICELGILVVEVKGDRIRLKNNSFYFLKGARHQDEKRMNENPFTQCDGNVGGIQDFLRKNDVKDVFVGGFVAFPESTFDYSGASYKHCWSITRKLQNPSLHDFIVEVFKEQLETAKTKESTSHLNFKVLSRSDIKQIIDLLLPHVNPNKELIEYQNAIKISRTRVNFNVVILEGLSENRRIMVEGPPGSGKSTFALRYIKRKFSEGEKRGLYLCWNHLLAKDMEKKIADMMRNENFSAEKNIDVFPLYEFISGLSFQNQLGIKIRKEDSEGLEAIAQSVFTKMKEITIENKYDFIVADEAQDYFEKGLGTILDECMRDEDKGLEKGQYAIFYDMAQGFNSQIPFVLDHLKSAAATFRLLSFFRSTGGHGLADLVEDLHKGTLDLSREYGSCVEFIYYRDWKEIKKIVDEIRSTSLKAAGISNEDTIVLCSSNILKEAAYKTPNPKKNPFHGDASYEYLHPENIHDPTSKLRYTTALRFKGLERDAVIAVVKDLYNEDSKIFYQLLIAASRAKARLWVLLDEPV